MDAGSDQIQRKPIVGMAGGIGSGKSFVARIFGEMGCLVINSDEHAKAAYNDANVKSALRDWGGDAVFEPDGAVNRVAVAQKIFENPQERRRLEQLLHPWINNARQKLMNEHQNDPQVLAFVWDTPLLFETGLNNQCDAVVFVEAAAQARMDRVARARRWTEADWIRREKLQWPLDMKKKISDYVIVNTADANAAPVDVRGQVREILSQILTKSKTSN